jgi:hypothetical protein
VHDLPLVLVPRRGELHPGVHCQLHKGLIGQQSHLPQRMSDRDSVFCGDVRQQGTGAFLLTAHPFSAVGPFSRSWLAFSKASQHLFHRSPD